MKAPKGLSKWLGVGLLVGLGVWLWGKRSQASEWPIVGQVASVSAYLDHIWSEDGTLVYDPEALSASNLHEMVVGQKYWIEVLSPCTLAYGGKTWVLPLGWTLITW